MGTYKKYSPEDDRIISEEVGKSPDNISLGIWKAVPKIFGEEAGSGLETDDYSNNLYYKRLKYRWYMKVSKKNTCMVLLSQTSVFKNRKVRWKRKTLPSIPVSKNVFLTITRSIEEIQWN